MESFWKLYHSAVNFASTEFPSSSRAFIKCSNSLKEKYVRLGRRDKAATLLAAFIFFGVLMKMIFVPVPHHSLDPRLAPRHAARNRSHWAHPVKADAITEGCPEPRDRTAGNNCKGQWTGKVVRRGPHGPYVAMMPEVKEGAHAASLVELKNGALVMAWFSGMEGQAGVVVVVSRLLRPSRVGSQWEQPKVVSQLPGRSNQNPVLFVDPQSGTLHLLHTSQAANEGQSTSQLVWLNSSNGGVSWTKPWVHSSFKGKTGPFVKGKILALPRKQGGGGGVRRSGYDWVLPMYYTPEENKLASHYCSMWRSQDKGVTWSQESAMSLKFQFLAQPSVVIMPKTGHLRAYFRDRHGRWIYYSESTDGGRSWPSKQKKSELPNNQSGIQVIVLFNGHMVVAFNNQVCSKLVCYRHPLSLALSEDSGHTWGWVRDLEPGGGSDPVMPLRTPPRYQRYSYPTLIQTKDGLIHVAYSYRKKTIKYVVVDENWIRSGSTTGVFRGSGKPLVQAFSPPPPIQSRRIPKANITTVHLG